MSRAYKSNSNHDPLALSRSGVETFKPSRQDYVALFQRALTYDPSTLLDLFNDPKPFTPNYLAYPVPAIPQVPIETHSFTSTTSSNVGMASSINHTPARPRPASPEPPLKRAKPSHESCVHPRPHEDVHYQFNVQRKSRTKMRSGVCVWCAARALMTLPNRPMLKKRTSGSDADWERWMRELASPRSTFLSYLADVLMPKHEILQIIEPSDLGLFYKEMAGALLEMALREMRSDVVDDRALMAQVRSSKYHKAARVAKIIERKYE